MSFGQCCQRKEVLVLPSMEKLFDREQTGMHSHISGDRLHRSVAPWFGSEKHMALPKFFSRGAAFNARLQGTRFWLISRDFQLFVSVFLYMPRTTILGRRWLKSVSGSEEKGCWLQGLEQLQSHEVVPDPESYGWTPELELARSSSWQRKN